MISEKYCQNLGFNVLLLLFLRYDIREYKFFMIELRFIVIQIVSHQPELKLFWFLVDRNKSFWTAQGMSKTQNLLKKNFFITEFAGYFRKINVF